MKKNIYIILAVFLFACNSENANDCFKTAGSTVQQEVAVTGFTRILVNEGVEMVLREAAEHRVVIETGKNLLKGIKAEVTDGQLVISNDIGCNFFRGYDPAVVYVTAPAITEIRSSTQFDVRSEGVLTYPDLRILSEDYQSDYQNTGNFYLHVENERFRLVFNNLSNCYLQGKTNSMNLFLAAGDGRIEAGEFTAGKVDIYHRGSNDIIVNPTAELRGDIYSTGNLIALNRPEVVEVTEHYRGKLLFRED